MESPRRLNGWQRPVRRIPADRRAVGVDYVGDLRMQQAFAMLNRQDAMIAEVAYAVGYGHPPSFSIAVQRRFGTSASELRRRCHRLDARETWRQASAAACPLV